MSESTEIASQVKRRRTFAIISHPDAGKTTLTEKLLLFSGAIQIAGSVKARKAARHATTASSICWTPPATRISPKTPTAY